MPIQQNNFIFGINALDSLIVDAIENRGSNSIDCMAYNVNLDYVNFLFKKYPSLKSIKIYSNSEKIKFSDKCWEEINLLIRDGKIKFCHVKSDKTIVHAKIYRFFRDEDLLFGAIGSPNFTRNSNQNFEIVYYLHDKEVVKNIWENVRNSFETYHISCITEIPDQLIYGTQMDCDTDPALLEGLWMHQKIIAGWMNKRDRMIINIPPGCGKTKISITYLKNLFRKNKELSGLILVPTKTLITQWIERLNEENIPCYEGLPNLDNLDLYFGDPEGKLLVTLYSRFFNNYKDLFSNLRIIKPKLVIISDECHNLYGNLDVYNSSVNEYASSINKEIYQVGLSATIDSFRQKEVDTYIKTMGGQKNIYEITFQSIYSRWNDINENPILKQVHYIPLKYRLTNSEMEKFKEYSQKIAQQAGRNISGEDIAIAAIERASWVRSLDGGINVLKEYLGSNIQIFEAGNTIVFVQTHKIAEEIRSFLVRNSKWKKTSSAYIFDSHRPDYFRNIAIRQFKENHGYCLIAEKMLSEGFDIPKISRVILHGSDKSERDWIQKIGRALRFDKSNPDSVAEIIDVVFCDPSGNPLSIEEERYNVLNSIKIN